MGIDSKYNVMFTTKAFKELKQLYKYISNKLCADNASLELMRQINEKVVNISFFPQMYSKLITKKLKHNKYRRIVVKKHIIIYKIHEKKKEVQIVHIFNSRSNYVEKL